MDAHSSAGCYVIAIACRRLTSREVDGMEELVRDTTVYMCLHVCVCVCMRVCVGGGVYVYVLSVYVAGGG